ncbi:MAG: PKD domain-containing protein [Candidatus Saliniplasma sp.]
MNSQEPPEADFVFSPENPKIGENVNFTDRSIEGDAEIVEWSWRFGDGDNPYDQTTSDKQNPNHTYNREGVYTVELNVTDENNLSSTTTKTVYVNPRGEVPDIVVFIVAGVLGIIVAVSFHILRREFETEEIDGDLLSDSDEGVNKNYE